jgi:hypothetical protein
MSTAERDYMKKTAQPSDPEGALEEMAEKAMKFLRANQNTILAAVLSIVAIVSFVVWKHASDAAFEDGAWSALSEARRKPGPEADEALKNAAVTWAGSSATPYITLLRASKLTAKGTKKDLEQAKELLGPLSTSSNDAIRRAAALQLENVKKELEDARTWKLVDAAPAKPEDKKPDEKKPETPKK